MDKFRIKGGNSLFGKVNISGAKNSALPLMCASLLTNDSIKLSNIPTLRDINTLKQLLIKLGAEIIEKPRHLDQYGDEISQELEISVKKIICDIASYDLVKTMRASILVLGPLLARNGIARISMPGGCAIGARPINLHLKGLEAMGTQITIDKGDVIARIPKGKSRLLGANYVMDKVTVTGTENLMMAATLAEGITILDNCACEPEVVDLAELLIKMGAKINGAGTTRITISGVEKLNKASHFVIPDRIETGTILTAVAACKGEVVCENTSVDLLTIVIDKLVESGAKIEQKNNSITIQMEDRPKSISIQTMPYPGFPTDMQAQAMALSSIGNGTTQIVETIFENRFLHASELNRMGAKININNHNAIIEGVDELQGAPVMATDLRASACLVIAGLAAKGETIIDRIYHLDRGYANLEQKLNAIGAMVERI